MLIGHAEFYCPMGYKLVYFGERSRIKQLNNTLAGGFLSTLVLLINTFLTTGHFSRLGIESSPEHVTPESEREARYRFEKGLMPGCRQSCAALVLGDVLVTVPEESRTHKQVVRKAASQRAFEVNPAMRLCYVELPTATMEDERSDWARLADELAARFGLERDRLRIDFAILPSLQPALEAGRTRLADGRLVHGGTCLLYTSPSPRDS